MNFEHLFAPYAGREVRVGLAGAGEFGRSFLFRSGRVRQLRVVAVADRDVSRAESLVQGLPDVKVVDDATRLAEMPLDMIVEATGDPEVAARTAELALEHGKHFAMVTKEADCVVGPILHAKAKEAGLVFTAVDGDQPALLVSLVSRARLLGLDVVCAGKSGEYDFVLESDKVSGPEGSIALKDAGRFWSDAGYRREALRGWLHATVPDYCEMCIVANATGLGVDVPSMHAPAARTVELPNLFRPGGLLSKGGVVDMFVCLRRTDELSFAGGVFVVVRCDDVATWAVLKQKGIPVSDDGSYALLHNPVHLLGIEAPATVLSAVFLGVPAVRLAPRFDLHARANRPLAKGTQLSIGERHVIGGLDTLIAPAQAARGAAPIPYYMAAGARLVRDVAAGSLVTRDAVEPPAGSALWRLREEQDRRFFS